MNRIFGVVAAAVIAGGGGAAWWSSNNMEKRRAGERRGVLVEATAGAIEDFISATGSVVPLNRVEIHPPIGGRVEDLLVLEGARVQAGQIIAWLSSNDRAAILDAARAQGPEQLARWKDAYKPTPIVAPLSGLVILRNVVVGQTVDAGTVLYAMADTLIVLARVDEAEIGRVRSGMPVRIMLDAYPGKPIRGKVFDILYEGKSVSNVITYGVKIRPDRTPAFFRSQMTANVNFILDRKETAVLLPVAAVSQGPGQTPKVMIPGPDGKPEPREVKLGLESGDKIEILSGLAPGDKVLLSRGRYIPPQAPQASPLSFGGNRPPTTRGDAPRPRRSRESP